MPSNKSIPDPSTWGVPAQAISVLNQEPEILADVAEARSQSPLSPDYQPRFIEYRVDEETAFFQVGSDIVVNRLEGIAQLMGRSLCRS